MNEPRGDSGRWCPDCGNVLGTGQVMCDVCGLDFTSISARDAERANGELHRIMGQLSQLEDQQRSWLEYRKEILGFAQRATVDLGAALDGETLGGAALDGETLGGAALDGETLGGAALVGQPFVAEATEDESSVGEPPVRAVPDGVAASDQLAASRDPFTAAGGWAQTPLPTPALATVSRASSPTAQMFQAPVPQAAMFQAPAQDRPVDRATNPVTERVNAMRPAKRLTAPVLLGVAGAALFILSGIVFVAASWSTTIPALRMVTLLVFAAVFALLARLATRHDFTAVGGALGVVSATFVGVGVFALTADASGPAPYTTAVAVLVAAFAGLGLTNLHIKAVGEAASVAMIFAVQAGAIEGAWRSSGASAGMSTYAIVATLGGGAIFAARPMWRSADQRATATYGGMATVFIAALVAVLAPLGTPRFDGLPLIALLLSSAVCAAIAASRPAWGAGVLTAVVTIGAVTAASMWSLTGGQLAVVLAMAALSVIVALGRLPLAWRTPGVRGLAPGLVGLAITMLVPLFADVPRAFTGVDLFGDGSASRVGSLSWFGCALLLTAALPLVTSRWTHAPTITVWVRGAAAIVFAVGTVFLAFDLASLAARGAAAAGIGLTLAAGVQWFAAPIWGSTRVASVRAVALVLTTIGGLHGSVAIVASDYSTALFVWGSVAVIVIVVALVMAALGERYAAGLASVVAVAGACAWTWHASGSLGMVVVVASLAALLIAVIATRLPTEYVSSVLMGSSPAYVVTGTGVAVGAIVAAAASVGGYSADAFAGYAWALALSVCVAVGGPVFATLAGRIGVDSPTRITRVVTGIGVLALALTALAHVQQALADAGSINHTVADAITPAIAAGVGAVAYGLVALVPWWRPARLFVRIGVVALISIHGLVGLGRLTAADTDLWWAGGAVLFAAAVLGVAARWFPGLALAPAIGLSSLVVPAALAAHHGELAFASAAVIAAAIAWLARRTHGVFRAAALFGGIVVMLIAAVAGLNALGVALGALMRTWAGDEVGWHPWMLITAAAVAIGLLAWRPTRHISGAVVAFALVAMGGFVPSPVAWITLAVLGAASTEAAVRWRSRLGLHPLVPLGVGIASVAWSVGATWTAAIALGALALASIWTAIRAIDGGIRTVALVFAPLSGSVAVFLALHSWNVNLGVAVTIAAGTGLTVPLIAAAAGLDSRRVVTVWIVGLTSVLGPLLTGDLGFAGLVVVLACAAWFTLSTMGVPRARWVAIGGLSVAAILLAADVGIATLEVYTAVPALSMILVGLWWLKREPHIRTYFALAPGLGAALVPSYIALAVYPDVLPRTLALVGAALVLAVVGVARRWFAPLLATAVTAVVVALSQATAGDPVLPLWFSVSIIGAVLFALAILAERIKAMR